MNGTRGLKIDNVGYNALGSLHVVRVPLAQNSGLLSLLYPSRACEEEDEKAKEEQKYDLLLPRHA